MYNLLMVGADIEVFLRDIQTTKLTPAIGKVGGTKEKPRKILGDEWSALQEDNVMLEFNINPAANETQWRNNINKVMVYIVEEMREKGLMIDISPSVIFDSKDLEDPQARKMGCDPDMSAWTTEPNELIQPDALGNLRTSGGHVHVTFKVLGKDPTMVQKINFIRMLDLALGVPSVLLDTDLDRRRHYGRAGAFRSKRANHIEYRTLSNFWIKNDGLKEWVYNNVTWAVKQLNSRFGVIKDAIGLEMYTADVCNCLKNSDTITAKKLIKDLRVPMPE